MDWKAIEQAIELVKSGTVKRVDVSDTVKVYGVKNVVRIDINVG